MKLNKMAVAGILSLAIVTAGAGLAVASPANTAATSTNGANGAKPAIQARHFKGKKGGQGINAQMATILGITPSELTKDFQSGETLAQIAAAKGIDTSTLTTKIETLLDANIDKAVQNGKLTADKATTIKEDVAKRVASMLNNKWVGHERGPKTEMKGIFKMPEQQIETFLGIDSATLKQDLKSGKSLAQIAQDKGISASTLISQIQSAMETNINQAVKDNKLSADTATKIESNLTQKIQNMVNRQHVAKEQK